MKADRSQTVELELGGTPYGAPTATLEQRRSYKAHSTVGSVFIEDLAGSSLILALPADPTRAEIIRAYSADIAAINTRRTEADGFMEAVLTTAMSRCSLDEAKRAAEQKMLRSMLNPLGITAQIAFTAEKSALPPAELAAWLKAEFTDELGRIATRVAVTLQLLADHNIVGLVDWKAPDVCMFHYFRWASDTADKVTQGDRQWTRDNGVVWVSYTETHGRTSTLVRTRHTHHVLDANIWPVEGYKRAVPVRIKQLIDAAPKWLRPHLIVIDGTETLAQEVTDIAHTVTEVSTSVVRYDPAIAIGPFALSGWNESEVEPSASSMAPEEQSNGLWSFFRPVLCFIALVLLMIGAVWGVAVLASADEVGDYQAFLLQTGAGKGYKQELTTRLGENMALPASLSFRFDGIRHELVGKSTRQVALFTVKSVGDRLSGFAPEEKISIGLADGGSGQLYGFVDLQQLLGLPIVVNIRSIDRNSVRYTVKGPLPPITSR